MLTTYECSIVSEPSLKVVPDNHKSHYAVKVDTGGEFAVCFSFAHFSDRCLRGQSAIYFPGCYGWRREGGVSRALVAMRDELNDRGFEFDLGTKTPNDQEWGAMEAFRRFIA